MRKMFVLFFIAVLNFIIQSTLINHFELFGAIPNTALIIVVCFSILQGKNEGAAIGFFSGILQDIFLGNVIGANALIYMLIGYNMGILEKFILKDNFINPVFFTAISTAFYHVLFYFVLYIMRYPTNIAILFKSAFFIEMIYNGILSILFYKLVLILDKHPYVETKIR